MAEVERLDDHRIHRKGRQPGRTAKTPTRFDLLQPGERIEAPCSVCGGPGGIWRDEEGLLQQIFMHEDGCILDLLVRHLGEEIRLMLGLGVLYDRLTSVDLDDLDALIETNLTASLWTGLLLSGEDISNAS